MFELTKDELSRCQIGTLNGSRGSKIKYLPFAFTELGVAMLSNVLRNTTAIVNASGSFPRNYTEKPRRKEPQH